MLLPNFCFYCSSLFKGFNYKIEAVFGKTQIFIGLELKFINLLYYDSGHVPR